MQNDETGIFSDFCIMVRDVDLQYLEDAGVAVHMSTS